MKRYRKVFVTIFFLLIPYILLLYTKKLDLFKQGDKNDKLVNTVYYVAQQQTYGIHFIPMEEYLVGLALANGMNTYSDEVVKAVIILMRSTILKYCDEKGRGFTNGRHYIFYREEEIGLDYISPNDRKYFTEESKNAVPRLTELVLETKGIYLGYQDLPVEGCFFQLSAGRTRAGDSEHAYLHSVICEHDILAEEFVQKKKTDESIAIRILSKDEAGYVLCAEIDGRVCTGDEIRERYQQNSTNFTLSEENGSLAFLVNGIGHGYGMSLFEAQIMAESGKDFQELLDFFSMM